MADEVVQQGLKLVMEPLLVLILRLRSLLGPARKLLCQDRNAKEVTLPSLVRGAMATQMLTTTDYDCMTITLNESDAHKLTLRMGKEFLNNPTQLDVLQLNIADN